MVQIPTYTLAIGVVIIIAVCTIFILDRKSIIIVYSWKALLVTILLVGALILSLKHVSVERFNHNETEFLKTLILLMVWIYTIFKGFMISLTGEGVVEDKLERTLYKRVCKDLFGKWALIAPWGGIIIIFLALLTVGLLIPYLNWLFVFFLLGGLVYQIWVDRLVRKHIKMEKDKGAVY